MESVDIIFTEGGLKTILTTAKFMIQIPLTQIRITAHDVHRTILIE
jgi:hypothetical protein